MFFFFFFLPILASLANTKITVYYTDPNTNRRDSKIFKPQAELLGGYKSNKGLWGIKREVIIYYEGLHYSHADIELSGDYKSKREIYCEEKIVFSSIAGGAVGGVLSYLVATSLLLSLWWMALGITLGSAIGFAMSYYLTEPQVENTFIKMQPECI
ncbi:MAG: hypothetical protein U0X86_000704 [Wolbachia endosymbiont of Xenopsylla cheopis]